MLSAFQKMERSTLYEKGGTILADTGSEIGLAISGTERNVWVKRMILLGSADDVSENNPEIFDDPAILLDHLLIEAAPDAQIAAGNLLAANRAAFASTTINEHYRQRAIEASASFDLIAQGHPMGTNRDRHALEQLSRLSVAGIMLDSAVDAFEDRHKLPQFTAMQLASGGLRHFVRTSQEIERETWRAFTRVSYREKVAQYFLRKPLRILARQ